MKNSDASLKAQFINYMNLPLPRLNESFYLNPEQAKLITGFDEGLEVKLLNKDCSKKNLEEFFIDKGQGFALGYLAQIGHAFGDPTHLRRTPWTFLRRHFFESNAYRSANNVLKNHFNKKGYFSYTEIFNSSNDLVKFKFNIKKRLKVNHIYS